MRYTLAPVRQEKRYKRYRLEELQRLDLLRLLDICRQEDIVTPSEGIERERLIELIWLYRGSRDTFLIQEESAAGLNYLQAALKRARKTNLPGDIRFTAKLSLFRGLETNCFDQYRIPFNREIEGTNAIVADSEDNICALLRVTAYPGETDLYLTRLASLPCRETSAQTFRLYILPQKLSDLVTEIYNEAGAANEGESPKTLPEEIFIHMNLTWFCTINQIVCFKVP
jgi:hypothetical protein